MSNIRATNWAFMVDDKIAIEFLKDGGEAYIFVPLWKIQSYDKDFLILNDKEEELAVLDLYLADKFKYNE